MRTTSGRCRRVSATASTPSAASATTSQVGLAVDERAEAVADQRLVVGEQDVDHAVVRSRPRTAGAGTSSSGKVAVDREAAVRRRPGGEGAAVELGALAHADQAVAGARRRVPRPAAPASLVTVTDRGLGVDRATPTRDRRTRARA